MSDQKNPFQPMLDAWMNAQSDFMSAAKASAPDTSSDPFAALRGQAAAYFRPSGANPAMAPMFDPAAMFGSAFKGAESWLGMMQMPGLGDLADIEAKKLHITPEWQAFQSACQEVQQICASAWSQAFEAFKAGGAAGDNPMDLGARWLALLDDALKKAMKSPEFLDAQSAVIRTGAAYKEQERRIVEEWCAAHAMPTRTEVDALHEAMTAMQREIAALKAGDG